MRKLIAGFKISLDGKITGPEGMADWAQSWSEDYGLMSEIDACLLGGGMYPGYENYWTGIREHPKTPAWKGALPTERELAWAKFAAKTPHYVLSKSLSSAQWPSTRFIRELSEVAELKEQSGKNIYLVGGAEITRSLLDAGLIDELRLLVHPLVVGEGLSLFSSETTRRNLQLKSVEQREDGIVSMVYGVRPSPPADSE